MVYDDEEVGEEDLEEFEVRDAIESYIRDAWADLGGVEEERREVQIIYFHHLNHLFSLDLFSLALIALAQFSTAPTSYTAQ